MHSGGEDFSDMWFLIKEITEIFENTKILTICYLKGAIFIQFKSKWRNEMWVERYSITLDLVLVYMYICDIKNKIVVKLGEIV